MNGQPLAHYNGLSPNMHGIYSSYAARIKQSEDNALLLPASYVNGRRQHLDDSDDDDFEEMLENSDDEDVKSHRSAMVPPAPDVNAVQEQNLPKFVHRKNTLFPPSKEILDRISDNVEMLVPIRLDVDVDEVKLRDVFTWNMNEQYLTPEMFAEMLCEDLQLDPHKFIKPISETIRAQVVDFEAIHEYELPNGGNQRVEIDLDLQIGKVNLRDKFEWELNNIKTNAPEVFSRQLVAELGLGGEYSNIIAHAIRDQLFQHRKRIVEEFEGMYKKDDVLVSGYRKVTEAAKWVPTLDILSNDELEKLLIAQERNIRRLRRETRFKRSATRRTRA